MSIRKVGGLTVLVVMMLWGGVARAEVTRVVSGFVLTEGGAVAGATVQLKDRPLAVVAGGDGSFSLAPVPSTDVWLQVSAEGYMAVEVPVRAGRTPMVVAVTLIKAPLPPPPVRSIMVLVRDGAGAGIANATLKVQGSEVLARTDGDGLCVLRGLPVAELVLEIEAEAHLSSSVVVAAAEDSVKVELTAAAIDVPVVPAAPAPAITEVAIVEEVPAERFYVTGSAIARGDRFRMSEIVITRAELEHSGLATIGDILQTLPQQYNGVNAQTNNGGTGAIRVDLRGLGASRTLILINGRRVVAGGLGADASVDLSSIPLAIIERVEILKEGASVLYGSDAIGGVINIITRRRFEGSEANLSIGSTTHGDGLTYDTSLAFGASSNRGEVWFSVGYQKQEPVFAGDREFSMVDRVYDYENKQSVRAGSTATPQGRFSTNVDLDGDGRPDGVQDLCGMIDARRPYAVCRREGDGYAPFVAPDDLYNYQPENYLYTPSERYHVFGAGSYALTDDLRVFFEGTFHNRKSEQRLAATPLFTATEGLVIDRDNVYNPLGATIFDYHRRLVEFGPRRRSQDVDTLRLVAGLEGALPTLRDWTWELSFNFGRTLATRRDLGQLVVSRMANALGPSYLDASGVARCGTPTAPIEGCVPLNLLAGADAAAITQEMIDYVGYTGLSSGYNRQQTLSATMQGPLVRRPWGEVALAAGADHRREGGGYTADSLTWAGDTTDADRTPAEGSYHVTEGFVELSAATRIDKALLERIELGGAAHAFDYSTFGRGITGKLSGQLQAAGGVSLRGTYSSAFRAPNIGELFMGTLHTFEEVEDPCDAEPGGASRPPPPDVQARCIAEGIPAGTVFGPTSYPVRVRGDQNLSQETAKIFTLGLAVEPPWVPGLTVALDYFHIDLSDVVTWPSARAIVAACYGSGNSPSCDLVRRDPITRQIEFIDRPPSNVQVRRTSGLDLSLAVDRQFSFGQIHAALEGTYLLGFEQNNLVYPFEPIELRGNYDGGVYPTLKANLTTTWERKGLGAGFRLRFVGGYDECQDRACNFLGDGALDFFESRVRSVDSNLTADLFAGYSLTTKAGLTTMSVGVNNVLDQAPPRIYSGFATDSDSATYDYRGRFVYARMSQRF